MAATPRRQGGVTLPRIEDYAGREQAYVKHFFLSAYLERLAHKVAGSYAEVVYVDGFSGPWQSLGEDFSDTSFGIALRALREAKASWKRQGREVRMTALLVERSASSHAALQALQAKYPDVQIRTFNADFRDSVEVLLANMPAAAFAFIFLDPKGWRIPMGRLVPLLRRPSTEVVFNFMFEFVNRAASMRSPATVNGLNELLPVGEWRGGLELADGRASEQRVLARKRVLVDAIRHVLKDLGDYLYVAEVPVMRPMKDRLLYSLVYATRSKTGIEVFRDCHIRTLNEQETVRTVVKARAAGVEGQDEMFAGAEEMGPSLVQQFLRDERAAAAAMLVQTAPGPPASVRWDDLWPDVLSRHAIRRTELNGVASKLRDGGSLLFPDWQPRKRVPQSEYRVQRP